MAKLLNAEQIADRHLVNCQDKEVRIEPPTRICFCADGDTEELENMGDPSDPHHNLMRKRVYICPHATLIVHRCPKCNFARTFGG
jgi:hypothetical protein